MNISFNQIKKIFTKPPHVVAERILQEVRRELDRYLAPKKAKKFTLKRLLALTQQNSLDTLWEHLAKQSYPANTSHAQIEHSGLLDKHTIIETANHTCNHQVNLLGSGLINLGKKINWHHDYKTNTSWPRQYFATIEYNNLDQPSDVKFPWELSRMQWMISLGQAYILTSDERYALKVRQLISDWITENPYAFSINWACTMEVALRIFTWTWFFHVFNKSHAWQTDEFRKTFLISLYQHAQFTLRYIEKSDVNGNHYLADAAALVFAGLFFNTGKQAQHWEQVGWEILNEEIEVQVSEDGVDYEGSIPYHRLVTELFLFPALFRKTRSLAINDRYQHQLCKMGEFIAAYSRPNGSIPIIGDNDNARTLPFKTEPINDHRYLIGLIGLIFNNKELYQQFSGSLDEIVFWMDNRHTDLLFKTHNKQATNSIAFNQGGYYLLRNHTDHIFIDCAAIGLAGRGGHGHNDCLSFEAMLDGELLIVDSGCYTYTGSYKLRNQFRLTAGHNTPMVDDLEINPLIDEKNLWNLTYYAKPTLIDWSNSANSTQIIMSHSGYQRIDSSIQLIRKIKLDHQHHSLVIEDMLKANNPHSIDIPLHLSNTVEIQKSDTDNQLILSSGTKKYSLSWEFDSKIEFKIIDTLIAPTYGTTINSKKLLYQAKNINEFNLKIIIKSLAV